MPRPGVAILATLALVIAVTGGAVLASRGTDIEVADQAGTTRPATASPEPTVSSRPTPAPSQSPTPSPTAAASATASPTPTATPSPIGVPTDLSVLVAEVSAVRGLAASAPVSARLASPTELAARIAALDFGDDDPTQNEADRRLLAALRLIPPHLDLLEFARDLYAEQVLGIYLTEEQTLYVGRADPAALSAYEEVTAAHEVVHALQDQAFELEAMADATEDDQDASLALVALVEGDAVISQSVWQGRHQTAAERDAARADVGAGPNQVLQGAPTYVRQALAFPYVEGARFVQELIVAGGFAAVDAAFARPPTTTEQILHPDTYAAAEAAVPIAVITDPGAAWTEATTATFGEFDLRELMRPLGERTATTLAAGWGGGRVRSWQSGGVDATALWLAFDTPADAAEVCSAVPDWYAAVAGGVATGTPAVYDGDHDLLALSCAETTVRVGLAPDAATASLLIGA